MSWVSSLIAIMLLAWLIKIINDNNGGTPQ